jgi:tetratricopeptide (TPR) repeat protein
MPTDRKTLSYLRLADEKVRKRAYAEALQAVMLARSSDPGNPYALAYEERIRDLLAQEESEPVTFDPDEDSCTIEDPAVACSNEILSILDGVNNLITQTEYEQALREIRRARHLDPADNDVHLLEEKIRAAFERQLEMEFSRNERVSVRKFISSLVESACHSASRGEFDAAFQSITQGALLDPDDDTLKECASLVTVARNQRNALVEEQQTASHCLASLLDACHKQDTIRHHAYSARTHILDGTYDDALLEIALALTIEPTNRDLRELEQEAWQAKAHATARDEASRCCDGTARLTRLYLLAADEYGHHGEFNGALDLIAKMRALDPSNPDARKAEIKIRQLEVRSKQQTRETLHPLEQQEQVTDGR